MTYCAECCQTPCTCAQFKMRTQRSIVDEREERYGPCTMNHPRTQALWCAYLEMLPGQPTAVDVCVLNILQKIARAVHDPTYEDNWVDIQGYAENILTLVKSGRWPSD